ncbi:L,D-transpeptidase-like protein [Sphingobacterium alimentarium]|uniref:L,D-transpeptidase-like protein n=1 Tax=Sphingobacterium alimentarium TaxID=797292 RepID=A0A4R3VI66_9SPHI|nr:murein L,D-transpeptidase catalytic domain family protein [Sphingobacterium alimentarium]TCV05353.1 L,D-transpeptidase-like protein [Sphingobacterium alimentarium]
MKKTKLLLMLMTLVGSITIISQTAATYYQTTSLTDSINSPIPLVKSDLKETKSAAELLYEEIGLSGKLNFDAFDQAMIGYESLEFKNKDIITVIDFTLPSTEKRMYVIDLKNKKLLYHTIVSHGRNSGEKYATAFSNRHGSYQSSLGFYSTANTYYGGNGYSLVLDGLEKGINDQAKARAVVIHGADYCSQSVINNTGRLGRSYGCPALPREVTKPIINTIKNGSMVYIYADNQNYMNASRVMKSAKTTLLAQHINDNADSTVRTY